MNAGLTITRYLEVRVNRWNSAEAICAGAEVALGRYRNERVFDLASRPQEGANGVVSCPKRDNQFSRSAPVAGVGQAVVRICLLSGTSLCRDRINCSGSARQDPKWGRTPRSFFASRRGLSSSKTDLGSHTT